MRIIKGTKTEDSSLPKELSDFEKIICDLGCGDGKQIYKLAKSNPNNYYIGIDSNKSLLAEISARVLKKESKGGLKNLLFIEANAYNLPDELENLFDEVQINFPWGSLLEGVALANPELFNSISKISKNNSVLKMLFTYNDKFEESYRLQKSLPKLSLYYLNSLKPKFTSYGIKVTNIYILTTEQKKNIQSSWGKKILSKRNREVYYLEASVKK